jgi:hypothetical protein
MAGWDTYIKSHREETGVDARKQHGSLPKDSRRNSRPVTTTELLRNKDNDHETKSQETTPHFRVFPFVSSPSPLQGQEQTDDRADEEESAEKIYFQNLLLDRQSGRLPLWRLEEYGDSRDSNGSKR